MATMHAACHATLPPCTSRFAARLIPHRCPFPSPSVRRQGRRQQRPWRRRSCFLLLVPGPGRPRADPAGCRGGLHLRCLPPGTRTVRPPAPPPRRPPAAGRYGRGTRGGAWERGIAQGIGAGSLSSADATRVHFRCLLNRDSGSGSHNYPPPLCCCVLHSQEASTGRCR